VAKSLGKFPDRFIAEIAGQPDAIRRAAGGLTAQARGIEQARRAMSAAPSVVFTGMGSSYDACYAAVTELAGRGAPVSMVDAAELLHFRLPAVPPDAVVVAVSQSGESAELVRLAERLAEGPSSPLLVSITNGARNTLAEAAAVALDTGAGQEYGPSTMTFAGSLAMLAGICGLSADEIEAAAAALDGLLEHAEVLGSMVEQWLGDRPTLALLGRGTARAAAEMGALTLKEAARFPAESLQTAQFRHGPLELAGPELAAAVFASERRTRDLDLGLAQELVAAGAAVLVISPDGAAPAGATGIATGEVADGIASAVAIVPLQLLSWALARSRGLAPGTYTIASKVTTHE
jgi:glucosamine--fructose-6-phosphate aminotransferase (isomerizing)